MFKELEIPREFRRHPNSEPKFGILKRGSPFLGGEITELKQKVQDFKGREDVHPGVIAVAEKVLQLYEHRRKARIEYALITELSFMAGALYSILH